MFNIAYRQKRIFGNVIKSTDSRIYGGILEILNSREASAKIRKPGFMGESACCTIVACLPGYFPTFRQADNCEGRVAGFSAAIGNVQASAGAIVRNYFADSPRNPRKYIRGDRNKEIGVRVSWANLFRLARNRARARFRSVNTALQINVVPWNSGLHIGVLPREKRIFFDERLIGIHW